MHSHSRLLSSTFLFIGLALLILEVGNRTTDAARGPATRAWTREGPSRRAAAPALRRAEPDAATTQRVHEQYGRLPLSFEENSGQTEARVEFLSRGMGYALFLSAGGEAVFALSGPVRDGGAGRAERSMAGAKESMSATNTGAVLRLKPIGARADAHAAGREPLPGAVNYLRGTDRARWRTGITAYARVAYEDIYPGIDLVYYGNQRQLEYDFIVRPGMDPRAITLEAEGADRLEVDEGGDLVLHVGTREVRQQKPVVYQDRQGVRQGVEGRYVLEVLEGERRVGFHVGAYDPALALVIDPVLVYSTYLGGAFRAGAYDDARDVAVDAEGHAYVVGTTESTDFPTTPGAYDTTPHDVFVAKLDASGATLAYSTFLGGRDGESAGGIAIDVAGQAYVTGSTSSTDFPTTPAAYDRSYGGGGDVFVTKLGPAGATLVYSTFLGGNDSDLVQGIAIDTAGRAYVTGDTNSSDFPTTPGAYDPNYSGGLSDAFVAKLDSAGAALAYSTFLGGSADEIPAGIAIDAVGQVHVMGLTLSSDFPTTPGAFDTSFGGTSDLFVTKLDATGAMLLYSMFLGGESDEFVGGIAVDAVGEAYVTGATFSGDFPVTPGAFDTSLEGDLDVFVTKLDAAGVTLAYSTFLGGSSQETVNGIAVDGRGQAYVTGFTFSADYPTTPGAFDTSFEGLGAGFVTKLDSRGAMLVYSTFLGSSGSAAEAASGIVVDGSGNAYVAGATEGDVPTTPGAYDTSHNGGFDAFVTKLDATGSSMGYSTYLGGYLTPGGDDQSLAVAVDAAGSAYVTGSTLSPDFPTTIGAQDVSWNGDSDVFVTKLDAAGAVLAFSTFLGGTHRESGVAVAVDQGGNVYVAGQTESDDFPTTDGAYDTDYSSGGTGDDLFVTKLDASGAALAYSTFLGYSDFPRTSSVGGIAVDAHGNAYVTGGTRVSDFPTTPGAYDRTHNGVSDVFLTKLDAAGADLAYSTFLGGSDDDAGAGVTVDGTGQAYVTGRAFSRNFPTTAGAFDTTHNGGNDVFVTKVHTTGATLVYSTFVGGSRSEEGRGIAVDALGRAYVTGRTQSSNFPTTAGAHDASFNGIWDVFITRVNATGATLGYSTYVGGSDSDEATGLAVDHLGQAHVTGMTSSIDFPTTPGAFDTSWNYSVDAFIAKLDVDGAALAYSTFLGGTSDDVGWAIAVDPAGNAYVTGNTSSPSFLTTPGAYDTRHDRTLKAFVIKLADVGRSQPSVNITANGSDGPLTLAADDRLAIALSFDAGSLNVIDAAEVYIGVTTPAGRLWFDAGSQTLMPGLRPAYAGPLSRFGPATLVDLPNVSSLPAGQYWWFVWVDYDPNGVPNGGSFDVVLTTVQ